MLVLKRDNGVEGPTMSESPGPAGDYVKRPKKSICPRCGDAWMFCGCLEEHLAETAAFEKRHGRQPTQEELMQLQPETEYERDRRRK